ncbi:MAG TPA: TIM barrel protein [Burkholderiaceae bacterium]|nr:TIM barrel protein [Burkholderiaceae bacterium]
MTARTYSLAQLTALPYSPPQMVQLAADSGCAACGIRLLPASPGGVHHPIAAGSAALAETRARIEATGVRVLDLEIIRIGAAFDPQAFGAFFEVGAALGARHVLVAGDDPEPARLCARFAALCDAAAPYGLTCDLEPMPWVPVASVADAARIVDGAGRSNGGVLVDALHFFRSASTFDDLRRLPRARLHYAQICDGAVPGPATTEGLIRDARCERRLPGEGGFDLRALFAALPADLPVSIEIPSDTRAPAMGYLAWARAAVAASRRVLEGGGAPV